MDEWSERSDQNRPDDDSMPSAEADSSKKFNLESLEPRILLSGDPVVAELAQTHSAAGVLRALPEAHEPTEQTTGGLLLRPGMMVEVEIDAVD